MHVRLIAVGDRQPSWVDAAFDDYVRRLPHQWRFRLHTIPTARRPKSAGPERSVAAEGRKVLDSVPRDDYVVTLDEGGKTISSSDLALRLDRWQLSGRDLSFVIGGPDGLSDCCLQRADMLLSLSRLTLPHGLARVVLVEQLYRAWAIGAGHPYHRE